MKQRLFDNLSLAVLIVAASLCIAPANAQDILYADFEQTTYQWLPGGSWTVTGTAFGSGPATTAVTGKQGSGLVKSNSGSEDAVGTLTSPSFTIVRKYIRFLIGGGNWRPIDPRGHTTINLLINGVAVRTSVGLGDREDLGLVQWNVSGLLNKTAQIQIVDNVVPASPTFRHINVDHILGTDASLSNVIVPSASYLLMPVDPAAADRHVELLQDGLVVRDVNVKLSTSPKFWVFMPLAPYSGELTVRLDSKLATSADLTNYFKQSNTIPSYDGATRPLYHFTAKRGFLADPCDLAYSGGWKMGYQHNAFGWAWDNMTHGYATSSDLVNWTEQPELIVEDYWGEAWNGTTAGGNTIYTSGAGYDNNPRMARNNLFQQTLKGYGPILPNVAGANRDPKIFQYGSTWVMALYISGSTFNIYNSTDLKNWTLTQSLSLTDTEDVADLFELPVDGNTNNKKWVFSAGYRRYMVGTFDGKKFTSEYGPFWMGRQKWDLSAAMTFGDASRRIMLSSGRSEYPGMPFNRYMNLPNELRLVTHGGAPKLFALPVAEVSNLRASTLSWGSQTLNVGTNLLSGISGEGVEMEIVFNPNGTRSLMEFAVGEFVLSYNSGQGGKIGFAGQWRSLQPRADGTVHIRAFYDRGSWEVYANDGEFYMPREITAKAGTWPLSLVTKNAAINIVSLKLHHMKAVYGSASGGGARIATQATVLPDADPVVNVQVFPNPFDDKFTVRIDLLKESNVNCSVIDSKGSLVAVLHSDRLPAGTHYLKCEKEIKESGLYVIKTIVDNRQYTVKTFRTK